MAWPDDSTTLSFAEKQMIKGFLDGSDRDAPRPTSNRPLSYRWGFMNALRDRGEHPRFTDMPRAARLANYILRRDNRTAPQA